MERRENGWTSAEVFASALSGRPVACTATPPGATRGGARNGFPPNSRAAFFQTVAHPTRPGIHAHYRSAFPHHCDQGPTAELATLVEGPGARPPVSSVSLKGGRHTECAGQRVGERPGVHDPCFPIHYRQRDARSPWHRDVGHIAHLASSADSIFRSQSWYGKICIPRLPADGCAGDGGPPSDSSSPPPALLSAS